MDGEGPVTMYHASEAPAHVLRAEGIRPSESGEVWLATSPQIADLQHSVGRDVRSIATVTVQADRLEYERSHGDVHLFSNSRVIR